MLDNHPKLKNFLIWLLCVALFFPVYLVLNALLFGVPAEYRLPEPEEIVRIALSRLGEGGYDILHNNCEHFVNDCAFGKPTSTFLQDVREKLRAKLGK